MKVINIIFVESLCENENRFHKGEQPPSGKSIKKKNTQLQSATCASIISHQQSNYLRMAKNLHSRGFLSESMRHQIPHAHVTFDPEAPPTPRTTMLLDDTPRLAQSCITSQQMTLIEKPEIDKKVKVNHLHNYQIIFYIVSHMLTNIY
jgi:hypothetical protein